AGRILPRSLKPGALLASPRAICYFRFMTSATTIRRTPLYETHKKYGGRLVDFHGWELPVQYEGILKEHQAVRQAIGLFDVSHMGQLWVRGAQALDFLQKTNTNDISRIGPGQAIYSHLPNERGGIVDDLIISCFAKDRYFLVVNAATCDNDYSWLKTQAAGFDVQLENKSDCYGMIAVQGPKALALVGRRWPAVPKLPRFGAVELDVLGAPSIVTRTGYTGEEGCEFIIPAALTARLWEQLMADGQAFGVKPCGLGCRDTLRLEAGYLLYGSDLDMEHSSYEAGYGWVVKLGKGDFIGRAHFARQKAEGVRRRLTGLRLLERGVPRPGCRVLVEGQPAGTLTSATFSPTLGAGIGMGYLDRVDLKPGARAAVEIHGRPVPAEVARMPFYLSKELQHGKA
ncbi:MAG: glycine cleavage system aminomethyltransferase GcvT, partial [Elusimicrobia bacterium]|nr:glycine cleavage system aminomethyltransferase GcvT [Elusimicrobiota bacterium]